MDSISKTKVLKKKLNKHGESPQQKKDGENISMFAMLKKVEVSSHQNLRQLITGLNDRQQNQNFVSSNSQKRSETKIKVQRTQRHRKLKNLNDKNGQVKEIK